MRATASPPRAWVCATTAVAVAVLCACASTGGGTPVPAVWVQQTAAAGWAARHNHAAAALPDGSIVVMGGLAGSSGDRNDVWRSTDQGVTWVQQTAAAGWTARAAHAAVALPDGSIVVMGGANGGVFHSVWQLLCGSGTYSADGVAQYTCTACTAGTYRAAAGATASAVCLACGTDGYYCPAASTSATAAECGSAAVFCVTPWATPTPVSAGFYTTGDTSSTRSAEVECEVGYWCASGVKTACAAGRYGNTAGLTSGTCTGACPAGRWASTTGQSSSACEGVCAAGRWGGTQQTSAQCVRGCVRARARVCVCVCARACVHGSRCKAPPCH